MNNSDLAHAFFYASENESKSASSFYFQNDVIYSYGHHFPICAKLRDKKGFEVAYLFTTSGYSSTTARHLSHTRQAMPSNLPVFYVPNVGCKLMKSEHQKNLVYFIEQIEQNLVAASKRKKEELRLNDFSTAYGCIDKYYEYSKYFKVKLRLNKAQKTLLNCIENVNAVREATHASFQIKKREEAKLKREGKKMFDKWSSGNSVHCPHRYDGYDHLKIKEGSVSEGGRMLIPTQIETSQGIFIQCEEAKKMYYAITKDLIEVGSRISHYTVTAITKETLTVGCHLFRISECLEIGRKLHCE